MGVGVGVGVGVYMLLACLGCFGLIRLVDCLID